MTVIWKKYNQANSYEIRSAGATRRLYTNGVCHSQYNPKQILTGSIWDLIFIPAYFHSNRDIRRVLVLGVGSGAIMRLLEYFFSPALIQGVELDETHLYIAKRFFKLQHDCYQFAQADARDWVNEFQGEPFDLIIEDLFIEKSGQPVRAVAANSDWYKQLKQLLSDDGILIMNFASQTEFKHSAVNQVKYINNKFKSVFQLTMPTLDNTVGVYLQHEQESAELYNNLNQVDVIRRALESKKLRYRIRKQRRFI